MAGQLIICLIPGKLRGRYADCGKGGAYRGVFFHLVLVGVHKRHGKIKDIFLCSILIVSIGYFYKRKRIGIACFNTGLFFDISGKRKPEKSYFPAICHDGDCFSLLRDQVVHAGQPISSDIIFDKRGGHC